MDRYEILIFQEEARRTQYHEISNRRVGQYR